MRLRLQNDRGRPRFWRPFPRDVADIICGEGDVAALPVHAHEAVEVIIPASRFAIVDGRGRAMAIFPGQVHVSAPLELHAAQSLSHAACEARILLIAPSVLATLGANPSRLWQSIPPGRRQFMVADADLHAELWAIVGDLREPFVSPESVARLLAALARLLARTDPQPPAVASSRAASQMDGVYRVCDYLRAHVVEAVSLDDLARVAGLSKFYLLRAFRRAHGVTPHAYQMQLRLAHAWRLIVEGQPLSRTTYDAGFADQSHLTRRFAAAFGLPPARYVRQLSFPPGGRYAA
jgi:AraC-like DNA-binding protein